jgi:hypothetical protein
VARLRQDSEGRIPGGKNVRLKLELFGEVTARVKTRALPKPRELSIKRRLGRARLIFSVRVGDGHFFRLLIVSG